MADLSRSLDKIKSRWVIGGSAIEQAPEELRKRLAPAASAELALLAVAAQVGVVAFRPAPATELVAYPALPVLSLPVLPDQHRPLFRRMFTLQKLSADQSELLLQFLVCRGYTVHPSDFMPSTFSNLPACYAPWDGWGERETSCQDDLTEDNWDDFLPAGRINALSEIRQQDPARALDLIESKAPGLPAEQRLRVVAVLSESLSAADMPYLEELAENDRSSKVQALAAAFLARLGRNLDAGENARELADFHQAGKKGLINRKMVVSARKLKTAAQRTRRSELYEIVSFPELAAALDISVENLISGWQFGNERDDRDFSTLVGRTGADGLVSALSDRILSEKSAAADTIDPLLERLTASERRQRLPAILAKDDTGLSTALACAAGALGSVGIGDLKAAPYVRHLIEMVRTQAEDDVKKAQTSQLQEGLFHIGLLADKSAAEFLIQSIIDAGMSRADAALLMLQLNAALTPGDLS